MCDAFASPDQVKITLEMPGGNPQGACLWAYSRGKSQIRPNPIKHIPCLIRMASVYDEISLNIKRHKGIDLWKPQLATWN